MSGLPTEASPTIFKKCGGKLAQERVGKLLPKTQSKLHTDLPESRQALPFKGSESDCFPTLSLIHFGKSYL